MRIAACIGSLVATLAIVGCIEAERRARVEDSSSADTGVGPDDTDEADSIDDGVAEVEPDDDLVEVEPADLTDGDSGLDTLDAEETEVTPSHPCLPTGCQAPDETCPLSVGFCWIDAGCVPDGATNPDDGCQRCDSGVSARAWRTLEDGQACDDGVDCTSNDFCKGGVCRGESTCTSSLACLTPSCDPFANECIASIDEGRCFIEDTCYSEGQVLVSRCARCDPNTNQEAWTPGDGHEPDDDLEQANPLPFNDLSVTSGTAQDPAWNGPWTTSTLSPPTDVDAFAFVFPSASGFTRPVFKVEQGAARPLEICVYMRCLPEENETTRPTTSITCGGSDTKKTFEGWVGCCRTSNNLATEYVPTQAWCERAGVTVATRAEAGMTLRRSIPPASPDCHGYTVRWGMR